MCNADYPQPSQIIRFINQNPSTAKLRDWYGLLPLQYLAMNKNVNYADLQHIMKEAPAVKEVE